jgi:16S rRNA processing protein RimM
MAPLRGARRQTSGSPGAGEPEYLVVARVLRPVGVQGELLLKALTDFPERFAAGARVSIGPSHHALTVEAARSDGRGLVVKFGEISAPEDARAYQDAFVYVMAADRPPLPTGEYYHHQLLGCTVVDEAARTLGVLVEILETGANDVYVIRGPEAKEVLLPAIDSVILVVDVDKHQIQVRIPDGINSVG